MHLTSNPQTLKDYLSKIQQHYNKKPSVQVLERFAKRWDPKEHQLFHQLTDGLDTGQSNQFLFENAQDLDTKWEIAQRKIDPNQELQLLEALCHKLRMDQVLSRIKDQTIPLELGHLIIKSLTLVERPKEAYELLLRIGKNRKLWNKETVHALVVGLRNAGDSDTLHSLLETTKQKSLELARRTYTIALEGLFLGDRPDLAQYWLDDFSQTGKPIGSSLSIVLLKGYIRHQKIQSVQDLFKRMEQWKIPPTKTTFTLVIQSFLENGDFEKAKQVLEQMDQRKLSINIHCLFMEHYSKMHQWKRLDLLYDKIKHLWIPDTGLRAVLESYSNRNMSLDILDNYHPQTHPESFRFVMLDYLRKDQVTQAMRILNRYPNDLKLKQHCFVDFVSYYCSKSDYETAELYLERFLKLFDGKPVKGSRCFQPLLKQCAQDRNLIKAREYWSRMQSIVLDERAYQAWMACLLDLGQKQECLETFRHFKSTGKKPSRSMLNTLLVCYGQLKMKDQVKKLFDQMMERPSSPKDTTDTLNALMTGYAHLEEYQKVDELWNRLFVPKNDYWNISTATVSIYIDTLSFQGRIQEIEQLWTLLKTNGFKFVHNNLTSLMEAYFRADMPQDAKRVLESFEEYGLQLDSKTQRIYEQMSQSHATDASQKTPSISRD
ncbi:hypothetical protein EDD86DRAFT_61089 [Gorgonomyces haynaldii]|nr:hypothetical protein EDD86DRAFT_61089 [Gorgonomyces haynaldii]